MNKTDQQVYNAIDLAKFICALLVVAIHVAPFGSNDIMICKLFNYAIQNWFARIAVPIFFVASGFFLYRKTSIEDFSVIPTKKYVCKLVKLYIVWTIIYFPLKVKSIIFCEKGIIHGFLVYCRDCIFAGSYTQLWYFPALIFAVIVISFLISRKTSIKNILIAAIVLYAIGLLAQSWFGVIEPIQTIAPVLWAGLKLVQKIIVTTRDGLFEGFLFVGIGASIAFYGFKIPKKKAIIGFIVSYFLMLLEVIFVKYFDFSRACDMYIFLVPLTYFAFGLIVNFRLPGNSDVFKMLRVMSSLIFYSHLWVKWVIAKFFYLMGIEIEKTCFLFLLTIIGSIACSYIVLKFSDIRYFKWLKKIYA